MNKSLLYTILIIIIIAGLGVAGYYLLFQEEPVPPDQVNVNEESNINELGLHQLSNNQKQELGISPDREATIEVLPSNTSEGATIRILNVAPVADQSADSDGDGLSDDDEAVHGTDPDQIDTDGDRVIDGREVEAGLDPNNADTLGGGLGDYFTLSSSPNSIVDSDGDGLTDYVEEGEFGTDPENSDTDGDGFSDSEEIINGFDPLS